MKITIAVSVEVEVMACLTRSHVRRLCMAAKIIAPTAPSAPASVGVARPTKIVPSTKKISAIEGIMPHRMRLMSFQPIGSRASFGIGGIRWGFHIATKAI